MDEREQLRQAIAAFEAQRAVLGDAIVEAGLAPMREKLAALEAQVRPTEQQRKLVTVLFADVSGFTAMSETMDPEDMTAVMNALWERLDGAICEQGGWIDKHIGDAVMALWGVEAAQENDPERAVRAALGMQAALARFRQERNVALAMRIGINTGPVLLGEVGSRREFTAMGDTVNVASRLEHAAPVGGILISHNTYRHVKGIFSVILQPPLQVKGKVEPLQVYVIHGARPRTFWQETRGIEGIETPMVGREAELRQLQRAFEGLFEPGRGASIMLVGEAGIGKSRLLYEFERWTDLQSEAFFLFKGRADASRQEMPYSLLRDLLACWFEIQESDPPAVACQKLERGIASLMAGDSNAGEKAHFIGYLIGLDFSNSPYLQGILGQVEQIRDLGMRYLQQLFWAAAANGPVIMMLEDLHWADESSLDAVQQLISHLKELRLMLVGTARPSLFERCPNWEPGQLRLDLQALSLPESRELIVGILHKAVEIPEALQELVSVGGAGNPFYVEELIKTLIEERAVVPGEERWQIDGGRLAVLRIPATLTALLQARFDRLPPAEQQLLQRAAVMGQFFWDDAVDFLGDPESSRQMETGKSLEYLLEREMIVRCEPSSFEGFEEFAFKSALLQEAIYEKVLKRERGPYHARAALWLQGHCGERESELAAVIGRHLLQAGQRETAAEYLFRAGKRAAAHYANETALRLFTQSLELTPVEAMGQRAEILLGRAQVYDLLSRRDALQADLAELERGMDEPGVTDQQRVELLLQQALYAQKGRNYSVGITAAMQAAERARQNQLLPLEARARAVWGQNLLMRGSYKAAAEQFDRVLSLKAEGEIPPAVEAEVLRSKGNISGVEGDYYKAELLFEQALAIFRSIHDRQGELMVLGNLAAPQVLLGNYERAREYREASLSICQEIGDRLVEFGTLDLLCDIVMGLGYFDQCERYLGQMAVLWQETKEPAWEASIAVRRGLLAITLGQYPAAQQALEVTLEISRRIQDRSLELAVLAFLSWLHCLRGSLPEARKYIQRAQAVMQTLKYFSMEPQIWWIEGLVSEAEGQRRQAGIAYQRALQTARVYKMPMLTLDPLAGLVRIALAEGNGTEAAQFGKEIMALRQDGVLAGANDSFSVELSCYRALKVVDDPKAGQLLVEACERLQLWADRIEDPELRRSFLEDVAVNRELGSAEVDSSK